MTREAFIRKYLGNKRYEYNNADIDLMRDDLDRVIDYHASRQPIVSENEANQPENKIVENLNIKGMMANHKLAQSIADLGLGNFYRLMQYKLAERGKNYVEIGRFEPSSRMCSCGVVNKELTLADREWTCKSCNTTHQRDVLAANNILKFGLKKQNLIGQELS
jgi:putative transposase